jgi:hypothetical protein
MGLMDKMKDMTGDEVTRMRELEEKARNNELDDKGREELSRLRAHFSNRSSDDNAAM